jgi:O-methyltransferase involved in polyketide biosynthesis
VVDGLVKEPEPRNRMREIFKSGSVGRAPGNRCLYLEVDRLLLGRFEFSGSKRAFRIFQYHSPLIRRQPAPNVICNASSTKNWGETMSEKAEIDLGNVQKTLLLPLWGRAKESQKTNPLLVDNTAVKLIDKIDYDFSKMEKSLDEISQLGWIFRCIHIDRTARQFLGKHPKATVVNIGCGLDTTFERVDNGVLSWYDLDLADVIDLRHKLIPMNERRKYIASSAFDTRWFDEIPVKEKVLFIAAGVLYYFDEAQIRGLFLEIADRFPTSEIIFDASSPFGVKMANRMVIKRSGMDERSFLKWGLKDAAQIEKWDKRMKVLDAYPYFCGVKLKGSSEILRIIDICFWHMGIVLQG